MHGKQKVNKARTCFYSCSDDFLVTSVVNEALPKWCLFSLRLVFSSVANKVLPKMLSSLALVLLFSSLRLESYKFLLPSVDNNDLRKWCIFALVTLLLLFYLNL